MNADQLVTMLSSRLAGHTPDRDVLAALDDVQGLSDEQAEAVGELRDALARDAARGEREMIVRETLETLALG